MLPILSLCASRETHRMRWAGLLAVLLACPAVAQAPSVTLTASPTIVAGNGLVTVSVANGPGSITDWVALAVAGSSDAFVTAWDYLNGTQTPPSVGLNSASVMMTAPANPGSYEARFYYNNGFTVLARVPFTVQDAASPSPPPPSPPPPSPSTLTLTFNPQMPSISATVPLGTVVATVTAAWSDGSPFTGTLSFGAPYYDDGGTFALSGNNLIVSPLGLGLNGDGDTVQTSRSWRPNEVRAPGTGQRDGVETRLVYVKTSYPASIELAHEAAGEQM